jgi:hypothetical protein
VGHRQTAIFYFYDLNGSARWVELDFPAGPGQTEASLYHQGACPSCAYRPPQRTNVGTARLDVAAEFIDLEINLRGTGNLAAMAWQSDNIMTRIPSAPNCHHQNATEMQRQ